MSGPINKRDAAKRAIIEIADHLAAENVLVSARFLDAVEQTLRFLASVPEIGSRWDSDDPNLHGVRVWQVDGFPRYLIFYRPISEGIDLIFVCHATRDLDKLLAKL